MARPQPALAPEELSIGRASVALFDLDRTLLTGSSLLPFARELTRSGVVTRTTLLRASVKDRSFRRRGASDRRALAVQRMVAALATDLFYARLVDAAERVGAQAVSSMSPTARMLVDRHLLAGDFCVVLSASPQELVDAVVRALGAHRGVGTRARVEDGRLTGDLDGPFCYGAAKLERLRGEVGTLALDDAWAYADSTSDLPVLDVAGHPVAVNPDRRLRRIATERAWPILRF